VLLSGMVLRLGQASQGDIRGRAADRRRAYVARARRLAPTWPDRPRGAP